MSNKNNNQGPRRFWGIRKISFTAILISIAVVFAIIGTQIILVASIPTFKISFIGLPVKITGFIFGPIVGILTGLMADLISFMILPVFFHPLYTLATVMNGIVSGIIGWFFIKFLGYYFGYDIRITFHKKRIAKAKRKIALLKKQALDANAALSERNKEIISKLEIKILYREAKIKRWHIKKYSTTLMNINMIVALTILAGIICTISVSLSMPQIVSDEMLKDSVIKNRYVLLGLLVFGFSTMAIFVIVGRFKIKPERYTVFVPIIIFSALLEFINVPLLSMADAASLSGQMDRWPLFIVTHIATSPIKIWVNLTVIYYSYSIVSNLINRNENVVY
ncbi:Uncharacterised protein [Mycoplasmopsis californica]|uniref:ECF transporter S component n=1 Tax=Mycoplasmopsis equigenitalium TaxID=114883 RepID=A0ABY5J2A0_9BACT|nr:ECF transporter S component [Mycoplasmopsis equigenitalium]UUD37125.1 ECF transporter S component [Mycoplasmopsis equigenitalium]VEU69569.1 Uncharacterised protein [Mycoplasmopsis californica]